MIRKNRQTLLELVSGTLPVAAWLLSGLPAFSFNYDDIIRINEAERKAFGHENSDSSLDERLRALESRVFGSPRSGSDSARVRAVSASLGLIAPDPVKAQPEAATNTSKPVEDRPQVKETKSERKKNAKKAEPVAETKPELQPAVSKRKKEPATTQTTANPYAPVDKPSTTADPYASQTTNPTPIEAASQPNQNPVEQSASPTSENAQQQTPATPANEIPLIPILLFGGLGLTMAAGLGVIVYILVKGREPQNQFVDEENAEHVSHFPHRHRAGSDEQSAAIEADSSTAQTEPAQSAPAPKPSSVPAAEQPYISRAVSDFAPQPAHSPLAPSNSPLPPAATSTSEYMPLFLTPLDLGHMQLAEDERNTGIPFKDKLFAKFRGEFAGHAIWAGSSDAPMAWVGDWRWTFPSDESASLYYAETLRTQADGLPWLDKAPRIGSESHLFGGKHKDRIDDNDYTVYTYMIRCGRVVSKLHITQGPESKEALTVDRLASLAQNVVNRIRDNIRSEAPQRKIEIAPPAPAPTKPGSGHFSELANRWAENFVQPGADALAKEAPTVFSATTFQSPSTQPEDQPEAPPGALVHKIQMSPLLEEKAPEPIAEAPASEPQESTTPQETEVTDENLKKLLDVFTADDAPPTISKPNTQSSAHNPKLRAPLGTSGKTTSGRQKPSSQELRSLFSAPPVWEPEKEIDDEPGLTQYPVASETPAQPVNSQAESADAPAAPASDSPSKTPTSGQPACCLIVLLDQSSAMSGDEEGNSMLSETAALLLNRFIHGFVRRWKKHQGTPPVWYVSVIGYGEAVGPALIGKHQAKELVTVLDLSTTSPSENRPGVEGRSTIIGIPVWVLPRCGGPSRMCAALEIAERVAKKFLHEHPGSNAPVVVNIGAGTVSDGDPKAASSALRQIQGVDGPVRLFNCQITRDATDAVSLPLIGTQIQNVDSRTLFEMSSPLPIAEDLIGFIRHNEVGHIGRLLDMVTALED